MKDRDWERKIEGGDETISPSCIDCGSSGVCHTIAALWAAEGIESGSEDDDTASDGRGSLEEDDEEEADTTDDSCGDRVCNGDSGALDGVASPPARGTEEEDEV